MARRKMTEEELDDMLEAGRARQAWLAHHPEEALKERAAQHALIKARKDKSVKKHQPVVTNVEGNGKLVEVEFTRSDGERVVAIYERCGWGRPPANLWRKRQLAGGRRRPAAASKPAAGTPPPAPAETLHS